MSRQAMETDQILLSRLALVERRLQALADIVATVRAADIGAVADGDADTEDDLPANLIVEPDSLELAQGFHRCERDGAGRPFRWAGRDEHFEIRFFLDRRSTRPFRMRGQFSPAVDPDTLAAFVDFRPIPVRLTPDGDMMEIDGRIPPDPLGSSVVLSFACQSAPSPCAEDIRRLSFAFTRLFVGNATVAIAPLALASVAAPDDEARLRHAT